MSSLFDHAITLTWPLSIPPEHAGAEVTVVYFSTLVLDGIAFAVCVFDKVKPPATAVLHAHGTRAWVVGESKFIYKTIIVKGCNVLPLSTPGPSAGLTAPNLLWPVLILGGVVSSGILASLQPRLTVRRVCVRKRANMDGAPVEITHLNNERVEVEGVSAAEDAVLISGRLASFDNTSFTVDVGEVKLVSDVERSTVATTAVDGIRKFFIRLTRTIFQHKQIVVAPQTGLTVIRLEPKFPPRSTSAPDVPRVVVSVRTVPRLPVLNPTSSG
ncbi:hypothetical protein AURDEDRAFT_174570 [Auricularia subglabra TFB-10046 SS5]|uniref:Uncharacterized protein n=1 Tax=Auricularia subglabra (strain TFB-10046 / SS5) TaxID=717982 RepID=J0LFZ8_AURST|nr:hypothetical protein AURDEDRAFT_174570 [Auricularia subglabra TFB-10046 SS5]